MVRTEVSWAEDLPERDSLPPVVYSIDFSPDGSRLLVAVGSRVLVYDAENGQLIHSLKGHKTTVYCVVYSFDGCRFASGGADDCVIIWTDKCEGVLKYSHSDSIQCLSYNPCKHILASCTGSDFGLWSPDQKAVHKYKVSSKVMSASWTPDGNYLALGQYDGRVSIRDRQGNEKAVIERTEPIWCLQWSPANAEGQPTLAVGCWDQTLSFYQINGQQFMKDRHIGFDPCAIEHFNNGEFLLVSGSKKEVQMYSREGVFLTTIVSAAHWIWTLKQRPKTRSFAFASNGGELEVHKLVFNTVHGLYKDRYAYRDAMSDVIIQHMISEQKVRIRTRDYVKKIAIYKDRLAIQLQDRILIYEASASDDFDMHYKLSDKIVQELRCNLLVVTSSHIVLCQERKLQLYSFGGDKVREWVFESIIRYIKVIGGPAAGEGLLVGLRDGCVMQIFIDNKFPIQLLQHSAPVRCLDLSANRKKIAIVDENSTVFIYDVESRKVLFEEQNANSAAWNAQFDDMFCFSGNSQLTIKTADFPVHRQRLQGFVVGFKGSKVFCLQYASMVTVDVFQSAAMHSYLANCDYKSAYKIACLGVTEDDWKHLSFQALANLDLDISRRSFIRLRDITYTELINQISIASKRPNYDKNVFAAEIQAYQGNFEEASALFCRSGCYNRAMEMYLDLRDWNRAKSIMERFGYQNGGSEIDLEMIRLLKNEANWLLEGHEPEPAAEMFWAAKDYNRAIEIMGQHGWTDKLLEKVNKLSSVETAALKQAAHTFRACGCFEFARDVYLRIDDITSLISLCVQTQTWDMALDMVKRHPEFGNEIYLPYAQWLAVNDRFDEAQEAFARAGRPDQAAQLLHQLTISALKEKRFSDASYYYYQTALDLSRQSPNLPGFQENYKRAVLYFAYSNVYRFTSEPFTTLSAETIFNSALHVLNVEGVDVNAEGCHGFISFFALLSSLAKQAVHFEAFKLARLCYSVVQKLRIPPEKREEFELQSILIQGRPFSDRTELLPVCYKCSTRNALFTPGDCCTNCGHRFVRSACTFEVLPLVEFQVDGSLSLHDIVSILHSGSAPKQQSDRKESGSNSNGETNILTLDRCGDQEGGDGDDDEGDSGFMQQLVQIQQTVDGKYPEVVVSGQTLASMSRSSVFLVPVANAGFGPVRLYKCLIPGLALIQCQNCCAIFNEDEFEIAILRNGSCPFCRVSIDPRTNDPVKRTQL